MGLVARSGDGRYEAIVTLMFDGIHSSNEVREHSLGMFDDCDDAIRAIRSLRQRAQIVPTRKQ